MTNIREIGPPKTNVKEVLESVLAECEDLDCIVIVGLRRGGNQLLRTSAISHIEKCFLSTFFNAWVTRWFDFEPQ